MCVCVRVQGVWGVYVISSVGGSKSSLNHLHIRLARHFKLYPCIYTQYRVYVVHTITYNIGHICVYTCMYGVSDEVSTVSRSFNKGQEGV